MRIKNLSFLNNHCFTLNKDCRKIKYLQADWLFAFGDQSPVNKSPTGCDCFIDNKKCNMHYMITLILKQNVCRLIIFKMYHTNYILLSFLIHYIDIACNKYFLPMKSQLQHNQKLVPSLVLVYKPKQ